MSEVTYTKFRVEDLFDIVKGKRLTKANMIAGDVPFIGSTASNNGTTAYVGNTDNIHDGGCITVSYNGSVGEAFYQSERFVASDDVNVLYPKFEMTEHLALYMCAVLRRAGAAFGYMRKWTKERMQESLIELPCLRLPDWQTLALVCEGGGGDMSNIDTSSWQEFKLKDLFDSSNGDMDIKKSDLDGQGLPVVTSGVANYGIAGRSSLAARKFDAVTITVDMFGNVMYRSEPYKMVTHARVFSLALKDEYPMSEQVGLYLVGALSKLTGGYGFNDMCSWSKICDKSILLPAMAVDEPDWDYMSERIAELEAERIAELEAYLVATGLDDCELTDEEREVLGREVETREFRVGELFDSIRGIKQAKSQRLIPSDADGTPYIVQSISNNMFSRRVDRQWLIDHDEAPVSGNAVCLGVTLPTVSYQPFEFGASQVIEARSAWLDELTGLYIVACFQKQMSQFSYGKKPGIAIYKNMLLELPVTSSGTPDWDYMRAYIRAQEKLVMADVARYTQERIDATREIVGA